jgi:hypothetical protein
LKFPKDGKNDGTPHSDSVDVVGKNDAVVGTPHSGRAANDSDNIATKEMIFILRV